MRSRRRQNRQRERRRAGAPAAVTEAASFARRYALEIASFVDEAWLDPDDVPAQWFGRDEHECPCCREREAEHDLNRFWERFVALAPCTKHEDCRAHESIGWACASMRKGEVVS